MSRAIIIALVLAVCSAVVIAQETPHPQDRPQTQTNQDFTLSVDVELVQLPISVLDAKGRPVDGLGKDNFQIFEDNTLQQIKLFQHEDIPLSLGLVIDNSGSMRNKRERVNSAALSFVRESNPENEQFIVNFDRSACIVKW